MKKLILALFLSFCILPAFSENYEQLYQKVVINYGEDRISDFNNIWNYCVDNNIENLSWDTVK
jgi:hypothetical protein